MNIINRLIQFAHHRWLVLKGSYFPRFKVLIKLYGGVHAFISNRYCTIYSDRYENTIAPYMLELSKQSKVFFDIGAHVGFWSTYIWASTKGNVRVIAFEPNPVAREWLALHFAFNQISSPSKIEPIAFSDIRTESQFSFSDNCSSGSLSSEVCKLNTRYYTRRVQNINVKVTTIDHYVEEFDIIPDFIKIDCEGHELKILKGAYKTLFHYHPKLIIEVHPPQLILVGDSETALLGELQRLSYKVKVIDRQTNSLKTILAI